MNDEYLMESIINEVLGKVIKIMYYQLNIPPKTPATKEKAKKVKSRWIENPDEKVRDKTTATYNRKKIVPNNNPQRNRRFGVCFAK